MGREFESRASTSDFSEKRTFVNTKHHLLELLNYEGKSRQETCIPVGLPGRQTIAGHTRMLLG